jgi:para-aminobenzoate synthetase component 1
MTISEFKNNLNKWGNKGVPFLFVIDFELEKPLLYRLDEVDPEVILFDINNFTNVKDQHPKAIKTSTTILQKSPISLEAYRDKFNVVLDHLSYGDSYLTNLTTKTKIKTDHTLRELFFMSSARYKLLYKNDFLVFSPEIFVQMRGGKIFSYPMKGTIDASIPDARKKILDDQKEIAEHVTIVDLIRNDLSRVADHVGVTKFRYVDELITNNKNLLQISSEISGTLAQNYRSQLGDIILALLPAGSICGAPKTKTIEIILKAEQEKRGYYTGVFGYFDGNNLDSGVMIRYIESEAGNLFYRSGGGITTQSILELEYQEMIDKVYVPFN